MDPRFVTCDASVSEDAMFITIVIQMLLADGRARLSMQHCSELLLDPPCTVYKHQVSCGRFRRQNHT
jgi:hypothetical protein